MKFSTEADVAAAGFTREGRNLLRHPSLPGLLFSLAKSDEAIQRAGGFVAIGPAGYMYGRGGAVWDGKVRIAGHRVVIRSGALTKSRSLVYRGMNSYMSDGVSYDDGYEQDVRDRWIYSAMDSEGTPGFDPATCTVIAWFVESWDAVIRAGSAAIIGDPDALRPLYRPDLEPNHANMPDLRTTVRFGLSNEITIGRGTWSQKLGSLTKTELPPTACLTLALPVEVDTTAMVEAQGQQWKTATGEKKVDGAAIDALKPFSKGKYVASRDYLTVVIVDKRIETGFVNTAVKQTVKRTRDDYFAVDCVGARSQGIAIPMVYRKYTRRVSAANPADLSFDAYILGTAYDGATRNGGATVVVNITVPGLEAVRAQCMIDSWPSTIGGVRAESLFGTTAADVYLTDASVRPSGLLTCERVSGALDLSTVLTGSTPIKDSQVSDEGYTTCPTLNTMQVDSTLALAFRMGIEAELAARDAVSKLK